METAASSTLEQGRAANLSGRQPRGFINDLLRGLYLLLAAAGLAAVLVEIGSYHLPKPLTANLIHAVQCAIAMAALGLAIVRALRRAVADPSTRSSLAGILKLCWGEAVALLAGLLAGAFLEYGPAYLVAVWAFLLLLPVLFIPRLFAHAIRAKVSPVSLLLGGFAFAILAGTALLLLPRAVPEGTGPLYLDDVLFMAASAVCTSGLTIFNIGADFTPLGQWILLALVQIGALSITIAGTLWLLRLWRGGDGGSPAQVKDLKPDGHLVLFIIAVTLAVEMIAARLLMPVFGGGGDGVFASIFHSVSAFSNAGFALRRDSLMSHRDHWQVFAIIPLLIIFGGLGFPVLIDLCQYLFNAGIRSVQRLLTGSSSFQPRRLMLHSRVVLATTLILLVAGAAGIVALDPAKLPRLVGQAQDVSTFTSGLSDWQRMGLTERFANAWFTSASARTAGLATLDLNDLTGAGKFWIMLLSLIGGSPASAAGGLKTVTLAILLATVWSTLRRRKETTIFGRDIAPSLIRYALTLTVLYVLLLAVVTLVLAVVQGPSSRFLRCAV